MLGHYRSHQLIETDLFTQFWEAYPKDLCHKKKGGMPVARKSWDKLSDDQQQHVLTCMREMMRYDRGLIKRGEKVDRWPFASTWLNQERWRGIEDIQALTDKPVITDKCSCGRPVEIAHKCAKCYQDTSQDHKDRMQLLYNELKRIGLGKDQNETKADWIARCKEFALENMGSALSKGTG